MPDLDEVFGVHQYQVSSYVARDSIDKKFEKSLLSGNHVIVYGASKQGKTALVSRYLSYTDNIVVRLTPSTNISDIYSSILRQLEVDIEVLSEKESSNTTSATVGIKAKAKIWFFGEGEVSAKGEVGSSNKDKKTFKTIPFNLAVAQDISELLKEISFNKKIILENFHYLDEDKQRQLAFDLRTFQETKIIFIVLGVWRQKDKLRTYCRDLLDRVNDVPVEPWKEDDFKKVIEKGSKDLNIKISDSIASTLIDNSFGSIGVLQELLKACCSAAGIVSTQAGDVYELNDMNYADNALLEKSEDYGDSHQQNLELLASGNMAFSKERAKIPLYLPYYLVRVVVIKGVSGFYNGLSRSEVTDCIKSIHHRPEDVRPSDISNLLYNISSLQFKKGINPPLIDYDKKKKLLSAVDSTFFYFLKNCDMELFVEELPSPLDDHE